MYSRAGRILSAEILINTEPVGWSMANKKRPSRRRFNLRKVKASPSVAIGALATITAFIGNFFGNADGAYRIMSAEATWAIENHTTGEGPLVVGYSFGDYTVAEIKEYIESGSSISIGDKIQQERANRLIRVVGVFSGQDAAESLNDGRPIKTRLNWFVPIGTNFNIFAYNDSITVLTTGTVLKVNGHGWVKDT